MIPTSPGRSRTAWSGTGKAPGGRCTPGGSLGWRAPSSSPRRSPGPARPHGPPPGALAPPAPPVWPGRPELVPEPVEMADQLTPQRPPDRPGPRVGSQQLGEPVLPPDERVDDPSGGGRPGVTRQDEHRTDGNLEGGVAQVQCVPDRQRDCNRDPEALPV